MTEMESTRWERIKEICFAALQAQGDERRAIVDRTCGDDEQLRSDVLGFLREFDEEPEFLQTPARPTKSLRP